MYRFFQEEKGKISGLSSDYILDREEKRYLLVGGDISGIQDFIYTVTYRAALKGLRGRSFYLMLLTEYVVSKLLENLGLTRASIIYQGGGSFYLLAQNTKRAKEEIRSLAKNINEWLLREHDGKLFMAIDYIELSGNAFIPQRHKRDSDDDVLSITEAWEDLNGKLDLIKRRKFADIIGAPTFEPIKLNERGVPCRVCGTVTRKVKSVLDEELGEKFDICDNCDSLIRLGQRLPQTEFLLLWEGTRPDGIKILDVTFTVNRSPERADRVYSINAIEHDFIPFPLGIYPQKAETFENMVKKSIGAPLLGTLRADVDNLGRIFQIGIPEKLRSLSRIATMSRFLSLFFTQGVASICKGNIPEGVEAFNLKGQRGERSVAIVYAGGDDLFITGAWSDVTEIAFEIRRAFGKFTCENPDIGISAGVVLTSHDYPIYRIAMLSGEAEEKAKANRDREGRKDSLTLFYFVPPEKEKKFGEIRQTLRWGEWEVLIKEVFMKLVKFGEIKEGRFMSLFSRGMLFRLLGAARMSEERGHYVLPIVAYTLSRSRPKFDEEKREMETVWVDFVKPFVSLEPSQSLEWLQKSAQILVWVDLLMRGGKE